MRKQTNTKSLSSIKLLSYLPQHKAYCVGCNIQNQAQSQMVFIPQYIFLPATYKSTMKQEESNNFEEENDLHLTMLNNQSAKLHSKQQNAELNKTIVFRKSILQEQYLQPEPQTTVLKPLLDYDSLLANPSFRVNWFQRNRNIFNSTSKKSKK